MQLQVISWTVPSMDFSPNLFTLGDACTCHAHEIASYARQLNTCTYWSMTTRFKTSSSNLNSWHNSPLFALKKKKRSGACEKNFELGGWWTSGQTEIGEPVENTLLLDSHRAKHYCPFNLFFPPSRILPSKSGNLIANRSEGLNPRRRIHA